ncbi:hypothetical protein X943_001110 [Babesia divergens]|uniref:Uncharacterized protein n=1 Tax=Babesia divergens TaxID=32595 RepID=A0AAD9GJP4_BABDI|nr:hypothetical protein X943_001110 [Babesia divergens]
MVTSFYDSGVCRQFNMLGAYIGYYEELPLAGESKVYSTPLRANLPPDCLGYTQEPTKGCDLSDSESSSDVDESEDTISEDDVADDSDLESTAPICDELLSKLQEAESTIMALQEGIDRMNKDHFELEKIMMTTYYDDQQRSKDECLHLQEQLEKMQKQMSEMKQSQQQNEEFWDERKREINDLMNDVILNVKDMYRYQELCTVFEATD